MEQGGKRFFVVAGVLVVGGAVLAGCAGPPPARGAAPPGGGSSSTSRVTASTLVAPTTGATDAAPTTTTTVPASALPTTPTSTAPGPTPAVSSTGPAAGSGPVLIVEEFGGSVVYDGREPSTIDLSGDSTNIVTHLTWISWGPDTAVGHGSLGVDNCVPNCAQGRITQVAATLDLSDVVAGHFTAMSESAGGIHNTYSYPSNWATGAS